jgi:hypothetical protein
VRFRSKFQFFQQQRENLGRWAQWCLKSNRFGKPAVPERFLDELHQILDVFLVLFQPRTAGDTKEKRLVHGHAWEDLVQVVLHDVWYGDHNHRRWAGHRTHRA